MTLTLYSRPGCHLCDEMKTVVDRIVAAGGLGMPERIDVETIDISADPALEARYGLEIPVLLADGRTAAKHRVTEAELRRILAARSR